MAVMRGYGIEVEVPPGWDGRISLRHPAPSANGDQPAIGTAVTEAVPAETEATFPVVNVANFALPSTMGDYGGGATEGMGPRHLLVNLVEFGPESAGSALFRQADRVPTLTNGDFDPMVMQRTIAGQSGAQRFFTIADRAFCLYVVLGSHRRRVGTVPLVRQVIAGIQVA